MELPHVDGGYGTILADPCWNFNNKGSRIAPGSKVNAAKGRGYKCMTNRELMKLPVGSIAAPQAHMYMWAPDAFLIGGHFVTLIDDGVPKLTEIAFAPYLMREWGFIPKMTLVWGKIGETGKTQIGMGNYFRHAHEVCIFGIRGKPNTHELPHNIPSIDAGSIFLATKSHHSKKPMTIHEISEKMSKGPRVELFARRDDLPNWDFWGDELEEHVHAIP